MNDLSISEIDRILALLTPVQLQDYKQTLTEECQDLAKQHIEATSNFCIDTNIDIVYNYEYKKNIISRICIRENLDLTSFNNDLP